MSTPSSSATIWASAVRTPWPSSTLPVWTNTVPSGRNSIMTCRQDGADDAVVRAAAAQVAVQGLSHGRVVIEGGCGDDHACDAVAALHCLFGNESAFQRV